MLSRLMQVTELEAVVSMLDKYVLLLESKVQSVFQECDFLKFPLLERLRLDSCIFSEKIKVSSAHLKVLEFGDHCPSFNLKGVNIDAPNLCSLKHRTSMEIPAFSILSSSSLLQVELSINSISYWDWKKLRQFFESFEQRSILTSLSIQIDALYNEFNIDVLRDVPVPPPSIKHLNLCIGPELHTTTVFDLVIGLLYSCCPASIYVGCDSKMSDSTFSNVLSSEKHECYCSSRDIKCWWHTLKDVQITKKVREVHDEITIQLEY
ncbi:hypothetical protein L6164_002091 [Bauhinia variegata]|uniref:Uncharacterized protein n=1 Tax=Bauhinia variegata TaxID=167791 RepID=A0ACB9PYZ9_BAUVA|nr:hypothetical protein L6164_002091 [Bauhinia variegata]